MNNMPLPLNRVFHPNDLSAVLFDDVIAGKQWPGKFWDRKLFENAQAMRAFQAGGLFGEIHRGAAIYLGVGAGREVTGFWLTDVADMVYMTDLYASRDEWDGYADLSTLIEPTQNVMFDRQRIQAIHMSAHDLRWPTNYFDGIYSSGSIEHFGTPSQIAHCVGEMARVLRGGGVLALSTEIAIDGPGGQLDPNLFVFNFDTLNEFVLDAADDCQLMDTLNMTTDEQRIASAPNLADLVDEQRRGVPMSRHDCIRHKGTVFTSVSIALMKVG